MSKVPEEDLSKIAIIAEMAVAAETKPPAAEMVVAAETKPPAAEMAVAAETKIISEDALCALLKKILPKESFSESFFRRFPALLAKTKKTNLMIPQLEALNTKESERKKMYLIGTSLIGDFCALKVCPEKGWNFQTLTQEQRFELSTSPELCTYLRSKEMQSCMKNLRKELNISSEEIDSVVNEAPKARQKFSQTEFLQNKNLNCFSGLLNDDIQQTRHSLKIYSAQQSNSKSQEVRNNLQIALEKFIQCRKYIDKIIELKEQIECSLPELIIRTLSGPLGNAAVAESARETFIEQNFFKYLLQTMQSVFQEKLIKEQEKLIEEFDAKPPKKSKTTHAPQKIVVHPHAKPQISQKNSNSNVSATNPANATASKKQNPKTQPAQAAKSTLSEEKRQRKMVEGGFHLVPVKSQQRDELKCSNLSSPTENPPLLPIAKRVLRWDFSEFNSEFRPSPEESRNAFIDYIKHFSDHNSEGEEIHRYKNMTPEQLINQYRRHYIPNIDILLSDKNFLESYGKAVSFDDRSFTSFVFLVEDNYDESKKRKQRNAFDRNKKIRKPTNTMPLFYPP